MTIDTISCTRTKAEESVSQLIEKKYVFEEESMLKARVGGGSND